MNDDVLKHAGVISLFSGAGGLDLGLRHAGMDIVCACENNAACRDTLRANHPDLPIYNDVFAFPAEEWTNKNVFMIAGGPPCQSFSTAGARHGMDCENGHAFGRFLDIVAVVRPPYVLIENVRGLLSSAGGADIKHVVDRLRAIGYAVTYSLYRTEEFGVPQKRVRVIIVGCVAGEVPVIPRTHNPDTYVSFRAATRDLPAEVHDMCATFSPKTLAVIHDVPPECNWRALPVGRQREVMGKGFQNGGGNVGYFRRIKWDEPAPTLMTSPTQKSTLLAHPVNDRPLSIAEYRACQTFPPGYIISGTTASQYRQIGNAVPPLFAECVGRHIMKHAQQNK